MEGMAAHAKPASQGPRRTSSWPRTAGFWSFRLLAVAALLGVSELPVAASPHHLSVHPDISIRPVCDVGLHHGR